MWHRHRECCCYHLAWVLVLMTELTAHSRTSASRSVRLHPISAHSRVLYGVLERHQVATPDSFRRSSDFSINNADSFHILVRNDIVAEEQPEDAKTRHAHEEMMLLVARLQEVLTGRLRISESFFARFTKNDETMHHPQGWRWAISANHVDLSGVWKPIVTAEFRKEFNDYLVNCSLPFFHRKLLVNGIALQTEYITQRLQGQELEILDKTPAGSWNRTLLSSGTSSRVDMYEARNTTIIDPQGDAVQVEAWWEDSGYVHKSWVRGKPNSYGGAIETARYLEGDDILVCESTFHPGQGSPSSYKYAEVMFRFNRVA